MDYQGPLYAPHPDLKGKMNPQLNPEQLNKLKESYIEMILDGMDMDTLVQFAFDSMFDNIKDWDEEDVKEEVLDLYDEEMWNDLTEVATESGEED